MPEQSDPSETAMPADKPHQASGRSSSATLRISIAGLSALFIIAAVGWAKAALSRHDLARQFGNERAKLSEEAESLRKERDEAAAKQHALESRFANDGFRHVAARQALGRGLALAEAGRVAEGLTWMAQAVEYAPPKDEALQRIIRTNLDAWTSWLPRWEGELAIPKGSILRPDGLVIAAPEPEGRIRLLRVSDGMPEGPVIPTPDLPLKFTPDGGRLLVRSAEGDRARIWDMHTAQPAGPEITIPKEAMLIALNPDGSLLATGMPRELRIFRTADGAETCPPIPLPELLVDADFEPSGKHLLVSTKLKASWYDVPSGRPSQGPYARPSPSLMRSRISFDHEGRFLAVWGNHWTFSTVDPTGQPGRRAFVPESKIDISALTINANGHRIATSDGSGLLQVWDEATGKKDGPSFRHPGRRWYGAMVFQPDGRVLVAQSDATVDRWRLADALTEGPTLPPIDQVIRSLPANTLTNGDGSIIAEQVKDTKGRTERIVLHPSATDGPVTELADGHGRLLVTNRGGSVLALYLDHPSQAGIVRAFRFSDGAPTGAPLPHPVGLRGAAISPDGSRMATGDGSNVLRIWDLESSRVAGASHLHTDEILALDYSIAGKLLLAGDGSGNARLYDSSDATPIGGPMMLRSTDSFRSAVGASTAKFDPDGKTFEISGRFSERWKRRVPVPMIGSPEHIVLRIASVTGFELDATGQVVPLTLERWREYRQRYGKMDAAGSLQP